LGLAIGLVGALGVSRLLQAILFGVGARDALTLAVVAAVLAVVAAAACFVPARRATKVDPIVALRYQ
jgi:putative ABC transport system permease protein